MGLLDGFSADTYNPDAGWGGMASGEFAPILTGLASAILSPGNDLGAGLSQGFAGIGPYMQQLTQRRRAIDLARQLSADPNSPVSPAQNRYLQAFPQLAPDVLGQQLFPKPMTAYERAAMGISTSQANSAIASGNLDRYKTLYDMNLTGAQRNMFNQMAARRGIPGLPNMPAPDASYLQPQPFIASGSGAMGAPAPVAPQPAQRPSPLPSAGYVPPGTAQPLPAVPQAMPGLSADGPGQLPATAPSQPDPTSGYGPAAGDGVSEAMGAAGIPYQDAGQGMDDIALYKNLFGVDLSRYEGNTAGVAGAKEYAQDRMKSASDAQDNIRAMEIANRGADQVQDVIAEYAGDPSLAATPEGAANVRAALPKPGDRSGQADLEAKRYALGASFGHLYSDPEYTGKMADAARLIPQMLGGGQNSFAVRRDNIVNRLTHLTDLITDQAKSGGYGKGATDQAQKTLGDLINKVLTASSPEEGIKVLNDFRRSRKWTAETPMVNRMPGGSAPGPAVAASGSPAEPPQAAVSVLTQHPELAAQFDAKYGAGMAARYLNGR
jgi:hypothetical protein